MEMKSHSSGTELLRAGPTGAECGNELMEMRKKSATQCNAKHSEQGRGTTGQRMISDLDSLPGIGFGSYRKRKPPTNQFSESMGS